MPPSSLWNTRQPVRAPLPQEPPHPDAIHRKFGQFAAGPATPAPVPAPLARWANGTRQPSPAGRTELGSTTKNRPQGEQN